MRSTNAKNTSVKDNQTITSSTKESVTQSSNHPSWIVGLVNNLSISQKIAWGYTVALGAAVVGTVAGFMLGDYYQQQAIIEKQEKWQEIQLIRSLNSVLLELQAHQGKIVVFTDLKHWQDERIHLIQHSAELQKLWAELTNYVNQHPNKKISNFLQNYQNIPTVYSQQIIAILNQNYPSNLQAENIANIKEKLLIFSQSEIYFRLHDTTDALEELLETSEGTFQRKEVAVLATEKVRDRIIIISMLSSVAIAIILAHYTSRAIARPLKAVHDIALKVTQESNFNLQAPVTTADEVGMLANSLNQLIQRVNQLLAEQKSEASRQLIQNEKMSSLGQMLAGVAHEINNPVNFIYGNLQHTNAYFQNLLMLLEAYQAKIQDDELDELAEEIDLDFVKQDLPKLLQSMQVGANRAKEIVLSLKNFSRLDENEFHAVDIHSCIESTLLILNNRLKKRINVVKKYGEIPNIQGYGGALYQVFMNILSNAIDALEESHNEEEYQEIVISTQQLNADLIEIKITDNGSGISPEYQQKIFETFFTTKPIGVGTGLGLSISYQIIVEKHKGQLICESEFGEGTTFAIVLPIRHSTDDDISLEESDLALTVND
ncbi:HAMP domain-containing histidine kinase [Nostoc sp. FACHB-87]|uniref:sensor histidine kinase n=1 Tax=Nostocales TaxID=1161 RepID=UPI00168A2D54|nr:MULTISPECIES: ATP-binding protein [Nostocales]MBD2301106.1 HAMP domain-containing histidine kinase [Nostoc sp. FACHB-190]MBD2457012.1 HAMP domain-containing histidine kinase [Nostoc sp. FACHB-87]MBD2477076.1 HAMP domain-containing histidine kinase [Anabaena sp. FACHB-83]MBD2491184.1 HAMP domain-containing histidine kinase [Aulosira sp. FACHB-615]